MKPIRYFGLLTDEHIPMEVVVHLRKLGFDVIDIKEQQWYGWSDEQILDLSFRENRIVLTQDSDFGKMAIAETNLLSA